MFNLRDSFNIKILWADTWVKEEVLQYGLHVIQNIRLNKVINGHNNMKNEAIT